MRIKLLLTILIAISLGSKGQIHLRVHQKDATQTGIPISSIDSVINNATTKRVVRNNSLTAIEFPISTLDSVTHAVPVTNSLYNVISNDATLSQFKTGIDIGELNPYPYALSGNLTALVPTNAVFSAYGLNTSTISPGTNDFIISYHTLNGKYNTTSFPVGENIKYFTANVPADSVFITKATAGTYVNGIAIDPSASNIPASNGVAHKLTDLLFPPGNNIYDRINTAGSGYDSIAKLVARASIQDPAIVNTLKSTVLTLISPSNDAFAAFLAGSGLGSINNLTPLTALNLLKDHMLIGRKFIINIALATSGGGVTAYGGGKLKAGSTNGTSINALYYVTTSAVLVATSDIMCYNGVIHRTSQILTK